MNRVVALLVAFGLLSIACAAQAQSSAPDIGAQAPDVTLTDTEGGTLKLADLRAAEGEGAAQRAGQVAIVTCWSFKCPTGAAHMKKFAELAAWCKEKGVAFVALDSYGETVEQTKEYRTANGIDYPVYMDCEQTVAEAFGARKVTTTYVLDRAGKIVYAGALDDGGAIGDEKRTPHARNAAEQTLEGKPVEVPRTTAKG